MSQMSQKILKDEWMARFETSRGRELRRDSSPPSSPCSSKEDDDVDVPIAVIYPVEHGVTHISGKDDPRCSSPLISNRVDEAASPASSPEGLVGEAEGLLAERPSASRRRPG